MLTASLLLAAALASQDTLAPAARRVLGDVRYLAADSLDGRGAGTRGLEHAADHIAREFARAGLRPGARDGTFFQRFTIAADAPAVMHTNMGGAAVRNVVGIVPGSPPLG